MDSQMQKAMLLENIRANNQILELKSYIERLRKAELCPLHGCGNSGCIPHQINEDEWEPQQCEFCYVTKDSLFNVRNSTPKQSLALHDCEVIEKMINSITFLSMESGAIEEVKKYAEQLKESQ